MKNLLKKNIKILRSVYRLIEWSVVNLTTRIQNSSDSENRVLVIYDTTRQPFAIGDFIVAQVAMQINCRRYSVKVCDIAIVYNPTNPSGCDSVFKGAVGRDNLLLQITSLMSILSVNPCIGSVFLFNSKAQTEDYLNSKAGFYKNIFPSKTNYIFGSYLNTLVFNELILPFYLEYKYVPRLLPNHALNNWADNFIVENIGHLISVTINIRGNPHWGDTRNSNLIEWKKFFEYCDTKFPVKFIVLCSKDEMSDQLRGLPNIIFAKDHHTELDQELALVANSRFHMGANSGPAAMAYFGSKPYCIFGLSIDSFTHPNFRHDELVQKIGSKKFKFIFSGPGQSFTSEEDSFALLCQSFLEMYNIVKDEAQTPNVAIKKSNFDSRYSWMR